MGGEKHTDTATRDGAKAELSLKKEKKETNEKLKRITPERGSNTCARGDRRAIFEEASGEVASTVV
ncbi:MAG: hypothetical protein ACPL7D_08050, partial [Candidatus Sumerlaeaceae bacterium]